MQAIPSHEVKTPMIYKVSIGVSILLMTFLLDLLFNRICTKKRGLIDFLFGSLPPHQRIRSE